MLDIVHSVQIRGRDFREHGIILSLMLQIIEEVFDVRDTYFTQFILSDHREDIEHQLIILFKRVLDFIENALKDLLTQIDHLDEPVYDHVRSEYEVVEASLLKYPAVIFHSQRDEIHRLKNQVDTIFHDLVKKQRIMGGLRFEV